MKILIVLLFSLITISCVEEIPFTLSENDNEYLIIDAELRNNETSHSISVELNSEEGSNFQANMPVQNADVKVLDDNGESFVFLFDDNSNNYINNRLQLKENSIYSLEVVYDGIIYKSQTESLDLAIPIDSLFYVYSVEQVTNSAGNIQDKSWVYLYANSNLPQDEEIYLKYGIKGIYEFREITTLGNLNPDHCFIDEIIDFDNISLVNNFDLENGKLKNQKVFRRAVDYRFNVNYCMKVYQERISKDAFNFWRLVENEFTRTGDIFEKPPGVLRGNITEQSPTDISVVGLFSVIAVDSLNILIKPSQVGSPQGICSNMTGFADACFDCLVIRNSSLTRPECFQ